MQDSKAGGQDGLNHDAVARLADAMRALPGLAMAVTADLQRYSCLPYCVLAAVFSINARYSTVRVALVRYRDHYHLPPLDVQQVSPGTHEPTVSEFIDQVDRLGAERFAAEVLRNRTRTSSRGGMLKAQAARDYAGVLQRHALERIKDVLEYRDRAGLEADLRQVHGQASGISTDYFFMNVGDKDRVKPDRRLLGFVTHVLGGTVSVAEAQRLFVAVSAELEPEYPGISPRALDLLVWEHEAGWVSEDEPEPSARELLERQIAATERRLRRLREQLARLD